MATEAWSDSAVELLPAVRDSSGRRVRNGFGGGEDERADAGSDVGGKVVPFLLAQVLYYLTFALLERGHKAVYATVEQPLQFAQTAAFMEILHSIVGLVRSPISATLPQITSRLFLTWGILWSFPETHHHMFVTSLAISWSITEIIRYSFFGMKEALGFAPSWLLWLRYSTFMVLYPTGMISEVGLVYVELPHMKGDYFKASQKYCLTMPNKWNFSFDYFYASSLSMALYIPGFPHMFCYMVAERKKALSKAKMHNMLNSFGDLIIHYLVRTYLMA